ncbi:hypothetical protein H1R20_g16088, partial [Candolleomyces eurysporus]
MSGSSYFANSKDFGIKKLTFNNYVSEGDALQYLHKHSATSAMHDSEERYPPPLCHEGTREVVICRIEGWYGFEIPPEKKIITWRAVRTWTSTPVGATFFFWRSSPERNSPARFIITLAYQFTMSIPELAPHIEAAVKRNPMVLNKALEVQLTKLIVEPFKSLGELDNMPHRLVIVDGLDECINSDQESRVEKQYAEDQERVQVRVLELIRTLHSHNLPLCFLILSRPEPWIKQHIGSKSFRSITETLDLDQVGDHLKDVEKFVRDELARIAESLDPQPEDHEEWPGRALVELFLWRTDGHMLYAATVIRHIEPYDDPRQQLHDLLVSRVSVNSTPDLTHSTPFSSLHELYRQILRSCPPANRAIMVEVIEEILAFNCRVLYPIEFSTALNIFDRLTGRAPGRGIKALRPLHALIRLDGTSSHSLGLLSCFHHSSFTEFLRGQPQLLPDIVFNVQKGVCRLLAGCFKALSVITIDGHVDKEHVKFSLTYWPGLWSIWNPAEDADPSSLLRALLALDLMACFVQTSRDPETAQGFLWAFEQLYHPARNFIVCGKSFSVFAPLAEDAVTHVRASSEGAFMYLIDPGCLAQYLEGFHDNWSRGSFGDYMKAIENCPPALDNVV